MDNTIQQAADFYKQNKTNGGNYIETSTGKRFDIDNPEFDIEDIAHALSQQCRFTGHTSRFYSVAQHCMLVATIMQDMDLGDPLEGLLHDGSEAYLSDIAAPWKQYLPDYKKLEHRIEVPLRKHFGLPETITSGCKYADWVALFAEAQVLIPSGAAEWLSPDPAMKETARRYSAAISWFGFSPEMAKNAFTDRYISYLALPRVA